MSSSSKTDAPAETSSAKTASPAETKMVSLRCSDGETFEVEEKVAMKSQTIKNMLEDCPDSDVYPLSNVTSPTMAKVIEYCKRHVEAAEKDPVEDLKEFETEFMQMETHEIFDLLLAANFLDIKGLLDLASQTIADMIKDKSPEEVRIFFGIENDFTPEEEEEIRKENAWVYQ